MDIEKIKDMYVSGINLRTLSKECQIYEKKLSQILKNEGVLRNRGGVIKHTYNENSFDEINEFSSYWLGFLMADGSITKSQKTKYLKLGLKISDIKHVEKFKKFLNASCLVRTYDNSRNSFNKKKNKIAQISLTASNHLVETLANYGVVQNKTKNATASDNLASNKDFWRGIIDGDGWITITTQRKLPCIGVCGSYNICQQFADYARIVDWTCEAQVTQNTKSKICYQFQTTGNHAQLLIENLYKNCTVALDRKLKLAQRWIADPYKQKEYIWKKTVIDYPKIASQWHATKNKLAPNKVAYGSGKNIWWLCDLGHEWQAQPRNRITNKSGCPFCYKLNRKNKYEP